MKVTYEDTEQIVGDSVQHRRVSWDDVSNKGENGSAPHYPANAVCAELKQISKQNKPDMKLNHLMALPPGTESETVATGFQHLDHLTGGLRTGQLWTVAARPGEGKTAFAVSLLRNIGVIQKVPTAYLSLESNKSEIMKRLKLSMTGGLETVSAPSVKMMDVMNMIGFHYRDIEQTQVVEKLYQTAGKLKIVVILTAGLDPLEEMREGCCRP